MKGVRQNFKQARQGVKHCQTSKSHRGLHIKEPQSQVKLGLVGAKRQLLAMFRSLGRPLQLLQRASAGASGVAGVAGIATKQCWPLNHWQGSAIIFGAGYGPLLSSAQSL